MRKETNQQPGHSTAVAEPTSVCRPASKWIALVNDGNVIAPSRRVKAGVLKVQAGVPLEHILVRDHGSQRDVAFEDNAELDLADGNVFFTVLRCDHKPRAGCVALAKRAYFIDDHPEVTLREDQTGRTLRELHGLTIAVRLFRDYESPHDELIPPDAEVRFADGPVFYTRRAGVGLTITVNKQTFGTADGVKPVMTGREIGNLITDQPCEVKRLIGEREEVIPLDKPVKLEGCEEFEVIRCNVVGGFEPARIERELAVLTENGASVAFVPAPTPAVIYRGVRTRAGYAHAPQTDVLVPVPPAYPGVMLDGAYLPADSPLLGRVEGSPQENYVEAEGRRWKLVSYHPHNGGGGPVWNPIRHGFHTYYSEVLAWIQRAKN